MFSACKQTSNELLGTWTHIYEKDQGEKNFYKKGESLDLAPARYRQKFVFLEEGICKFTQLGATDRHGMQEGTYEIKGSQLKVYDDKGELNYHFEITKKADGALWLMKQ